MIDLYPRLRRAARYIRRAFAREMQCPETRQNWGQPTVRCDLVFRHRGLHQWSDGHGVWAWSTSGWYASYIPRHPPGLDP